MSLKHTFVSAKSDGGDATLVQPSNWNADHVVDGNGVLIVADATAPAAPAAGYVTLFGALQADAAVPSYIGPSGAPMPLQAMLGKTRWATWITSGNTTSGPTALGMPVVTVQGTGTARNCATTNLFTLARRFGGVSSSAAGSFTGCRCSSFQFARGNAAGMGGFRFTARWGCSDAATVSGARTFVGMAAASVGAIDPSSATNMVGIGTDAADSNLQIMHNDGSGTATKINLGANFPDHTLSTDLYELVLYCAPNSSTIGYQVTRLNTGDTASGTLSTDLPVNTTLLGPQFMRNNGATALSVGIDFVSLHIETEN